jgi:hypothetical protein
MFYRLFLFSTLTTFTVLSQNVVVCPAYFNTNGYINDLGLLSDSVSWNNVQTINGVCHTYTNVFESEGIYDTRMRVYEADNLIIFTFRPTQQNDEGGKIHLERRLVPVDFFNGTGFVNDRMQQGFKSLTKNFPYEIIENKTVLMGSHSLGGIFTQFMMVYLQEVLNITTKLSIGLAGPFIGDKYFYDLYQARFKNNNLTIWWQVETIEIDHPSNFDGTIEGYNVPFSPFIFIAENAICGLDITVQPNTYGMHDIINYRSALVGNECSFLT